MPRCSLQSLLYPKALMCGAAHLTHRCSTSFFLHGRRTLRLVRPLAQSRRPASDCSRFSCQRLYTYRPIVACSAVARREDDKVASQRIALLMRMLEKEGIPPNIVKPGEFTRSLCPRCKGGSSREMSLSLFVRADGESAFWSCFRAKCGWKGNMLASGDVKTTFINTVKASTQRMLTEEKLQLEPLCKELIMYFHERMISAETLRRNAVMQRKYSNEIVIAFTYRRKGALVSCKYRTVSKKFWQEKDTERIFYGLDDIEQSNDIIIVIFLSITYLCMHFHLESYLFSSFLHFSPFTSWYYEVEGEMDKLSMEEAGYCNCVSVPDGAPAKVSDKTPSEQEDTKFQYLWNCKEYLDKASRIILATDADPPGQALAEELARRLGKERCWRVKWPKKNDTEACKDANEVLMYLGPEALREVIEGAELYPIRGLFSFSDFFTEIDAYYSQSHGFELGASTGWKGVDKFYKVVPGELTVVTGVPNSGKSEWIDALMCNINETNEWKFVLCSMENKVREHARKLLEKHIGKPFFNARYGGLTERMSDEELKDGKEWLNDTFYLIRCEDDCLPSIKWVLQLAKAAVMRHGVRGLVIDPYNELDHQRPPSQTETEYVSQILTKIKRFAQHHSCHVWFVAHPRQLQNWNGEPPNLYDISGSAHFINKCDNGIVIHRNRDEKDGPIDRVQVCVRKVRNKVVGGIGDAFLSYNRVTGEFVDVDADKPRR